MPTMLTKNYSIQNVHNFVVKARGHHYGRVIKGHGYSVSSDLKDLLLRDDGFTPRNFILERYFNDIYKMFLAQLTRLAAGEKITKTEHHKLTKLLDEIVKVKEMLEREKVQ